MKAEAGGRYRVRSPVKENICRRRCSISATTRKSRTFLRPPLFLSGLQTLFVRVRARHLFRSLLSWKGTISNESPLVPSKLSEKGRDFLSGEDKFAISALQTRYIYIYIYTVLSSVLERRSCRNNGRLKFSL